MLQEEALVESFRFDYAPWGLSNISIYIHISLYIYIPFWRHFWVDDFPFPKWDMFPKRLSWPVAQLGRNMWIWKSLNLTQPCPNSHWITKAAKKEVAILELNLSYLAGVCYKKCFAEFKSMPQKLVEICFNHRNLWRKQQKAHIFQRWVSLVSPLCFWKRPDRWRLTNWNAWRWNWLGMCWGWEEQGSKWFIYFI